MIKIYNQAGDCVRTSQNLRGILEHARKVKPVNIVLQKNNDGSGTLRIWFADYSHTFAHFASFSVLRDWVKARRTWAGYDFVAIA